jgi:hypothetical protein
MIVRWTMAEAERCPRCGKSLVVHGTILRRVGGGFRPEGLRLFSLSFQIPEVPFSGDAAACAACGMVWSELDAAALRRKLRDLGNEEVKRHLAIEDDE